MPPRKLFYVLCGFLALCLIWLLRYWECQFLQDIGLSDLSAKFCPPPPVVRFHLPPPPYISFKYANAQMQPSAADAVVTNLNNGSATLDQVAAGSQFSTTSCSYEAAGRPSLNLSFSGNPPPTRGYVSIDTSAQALPAPASLSPCQNNFLPFQITLRADSLTALNQTTNTGIADVTFLTSSGGRTTVHASSETSPVCGFFQFTLTQFDTNPDGSANPSGNAGGNFGLLLRDDCGNPTNSATVVVVTGGYFLVPQS